MSGAAPAHRGRRDNGLDSEQFSPVADVDPRLADHLLDVLGLREVPAYVEPTVANGPVTADRLYVASHLTAEAKGVLGELAAELGIEISQHGQQDRPAAADPLAGLDTEAEFAAIIAGLEDLDRPLFDPRTSPAAHAANESGPAGHSDQVDEAEHFVPPPPPPLPRLEVGTAVAAVMTLLGFVVLVFGSALGLGPDLPLPLGVILVLTGLGALIMRLRPNPRDDSDDDGAVV